ncbi:MAG: hypothetical protein BAJATHORv1_40187 [Candidatus Thorarchaeota archaeon]|nr:MAG: hypothetical protein BAJATHORv1_40187 [Candidatus Thorarchaeota archaeon]
MYYCSSADDTTRCIYESPLVQVHDRYLILLLLPDEHIQNAISISQNLKLLQEFVFV